jgi:hypothetical protein
LIVSFIRDHFDQERHVGLLAHWSNGNVADCTEFSAIVEVFILQTEKVPNESPAMIE